MIESAALVSEGDLPALWSGLLASFKDRPGIWSLLAPGRFEGIEGDKALVRFPNHLEQFPKMLSRHGKPEQIGVELSRLVGKTVGVKFEVDPSWTAVCPENPRPAQKPPATCQDTGPVLPVRVSMLPPRPSLSKKRSGLLAQIDYELQIAQLVKCKQSVIQSPIERAFLEAYLRRLFLDSIIVAGSAIKVPDGNEFADELLAYPAVTPHRWDQAHQLDVISLQHPIGQYYADFLLLRFKRKDEEFRRFPAIVVECDGHDYHERTKKQAKHDRERDRSMQMMDFRVMRFTGSELFRDSDGCASEVQKMWKHLEGVS